MTNNRIKVRTIASPINQCLVRQKRHHERRIERERAEIVADAPR